MLEPIFLAALTATVLLGCMLFRALCAQRRRARFELRLRAIAIAATDVDEPSVSLRRARPARTALPLLFSSRIESELAATGDRIGVLHLAISGIAAAAAVGLAGVAAEFRGTFVVAVCGAAGIAAPAVLVHFLQSRYRRQFLEAFPDALDLIVRAVRAGLPLPDAMEVVTREIATPVGGEFQRLLDELRIGTPLGQALQCTADRIRVPDFQFFVVSLLLQSQTGGAIAETLANLSAIIRQRKALRLKAHALTAEARASAMVMGATPLAAGVGLFLINHELMQVLVIDPRGRFLLGLAVASLVSGIIAMKLIIKRNLR